MTIVYLLLIVVSAFIFSWMFSAMLLHAAKRLGWFDVPGERSNHSKPTPKGGGIAVMIAGIGFLMVAGAEAHLVLAALFLAVVSFLDDWRGLSVRARLVCQILAIAYVLPNIPGSVTDGFLPGWLEMGLCALACGLLTCIISWTASTALPWRRPFRWAWALPRWPCCRAA